MAKNFILILVLTFTTRLAFAQTSNLVLFSEKSEPFTLVINGKQVNTSPALNIKVTNLETSRYHLRVLFNNPLMPEFEDNININEGIEATFALQSDNRGVTVLRFVNEFSLYYRPIPPSPQQSIAFSGPVSYTPPVVASTQGTSGGSVNIDINTGGQASDIQPSGGEITTTTTISTTTVEGEIVEGEIVEGEIVEGEGGEGEPLRPSPLPGYNGPIGCDWPMEAEEFTNAKESIDSKSFSDSKMRVAKQIARSNCLLAVQVKDLLELFSFETDKLEFAKFAYDFTYDRGNYYMVNDAFSFESSIEDLENYLQAR